MEFNVIGISRVFRRIYTSVLVLGVFLMMTSCTRTPENNTEEQGENSFKASVKPPAVPAVSAAKPEVFSVVPEVWRPMAYRLAADGLSGPDVDDFFIRIGDTPSQDPMGRKIKELYTRKFVKRPPADPSAPRVPRPIFYKNVVTDENAAKCREFISANEEYFAASEARFGVPREIAAALLFVETRLGSSLGSQPAAFTLASMAYSRVPQNIDQWFGELPGYEEHLDWMVEIMPRRADWAYKELRALLTHARANRLDPLSMPGSIYGAIGMCQFMPSNLTAYAADGNGDGVIDLFTLPDALASLSNYLVKHGWKPDISRETQHAILKRYNNADIYANTIIALSDKVAGKDLPLPMYVKKQAKNKAVAKVNAPVKGVVKTKASTKRVAAKQPSGRAAVVKQK